jgi:glycosyltransferase involved in cell wall biosynthesis
MAAWTILTGEFPPACGGVGDYTAQLAGALVDNGDSVTVVCPPRAGGSAPPPGVELVMLDDVYGSASREALDRRLAARRTILLVQYVPTAFGMGGANILFCRWLLGRSRRHGDDVRVMFHEPYFEFGWTPVHQSPLSLAQRLMARILLRASRLTYLSTDAWRRYLQPYSLAGTGHPFVTLPIPSAIPRCDRPPGARDLRARLTGPDGATLIGHFGTYGAQIAPLLQDALLDLLRGDAGLHAICAGAGSEGFVQSLLASEVGLGGRLHATGRTDAVEVSVVLTACDLLLQPYPDGVTTRRTSVMAGLTNSRPVVTTTGHLTESVWAETGAVAMTPAGDTTAFVEAARRLLADPVRRNALGLRAEATYRERFSLEHTVVTLRAAAGAVASP